MRSSNSKERIQEMMDFFSLSRKDLCERTGIDKGTLSYYLSGKKEPKQDKLIALGEPFGVDPVWLMGIDVPMFKSDDEDMDELANVVKKFNDMESLCVLSDDEINLIKRYRAVDDVTKEMVKRILTIK